MESCYRMHYKILLIRYFSYDNVKHLSIHVYYTKKQIESFIYRHVLLFQKGCIPIPCVNGVCKECEAGQFRCQCDPGFEGTLCDTMEGKNMSSGILLKI